MKTAWFLDVSQSPIGLETLTIRVKTRPYHFFLPKEAFRTEQEALSKASSLIQATLYAKIERGASECSLHPAYGHWRGDVSCGPQTMPYTSPFQKEMKDVPRSLIGMQ